MMNILKRAGKAALVLAGVALGTLAQKVVGDTLKETTKELLSMAKQGWNILKNKFFSKVRYAAA